MDLEDFKCYICLDYVSTHHFICHNGHKACYMCILDKETNEKQIEKCSLCKSLIFRTVQNLIQDFYKSQNIIRKCPHDTCKKTSEDPDFDKHIIDCDSYKILCPRYDCDENIYPSMKHIMKHFVKCHGYSICDPDKLISINLKAEQNFIVQLNDSVFAMVDIEIDSDNFVPTLTCQLESIGKKGIDGKCGILLNGYNFDLTKNNKYIFVRSLQDYKIAFLGFPKIKNKLS